MEKNLIGIKLSERSWMQVYILFDSIYRKSYSRSLMTEVRSLVACGTHDGVTAEKQQETLWELECSYILIGMDATQVCKFITSQ